MIIRPRKPLSLAVNFDNSLSKFRLDIEYDYDFLLIGLVCHEKDYRLCWAVNRELGIDLERTGPLAISLKKGEAPARFALYLHENNDNGTACFIVSNRSEPDSNGEVGLLVPEQKEADFLFVAKGPFGEREEARMIEGLKKIPFVLLTIRLVPAELKSKENLLF
jgi:hypothetical protein